MEENKNIEKVDVLFEKVAKLIVQSRQRVASAINLAEVYTKYRIGQYIVEYEQRGNVRAEYGKQVLRDLSARLTQRFGEGWSYPSMKNIRQFYQVYSEKLNGVYPIDDEKAKQRLANSDIISITQNDALVELTLPKEANIYATAYQLYLPDKALLQAKVKEWIEEFNEKEQEE